MNQNNEAWGLDWSGVDTQSMDGPPPGKYTFELVAAPRGINKNGQPYVNAECRVVQSDDASQLGKSHFEYLSLEANRLGFTKAFFENIGASHCLMKSRSPSDAVGSVFTADIKEAVTKNGTYKNLKHIVAVDVDGLEDGEDKEDEGVEEEEESAEEESVEEEAPAVRKRTKPIAAKAGGRR